MFSRRRKTAPYGPYPRVGEVDVTGLSCGVQIFCDTGAAAAAASVVLVQGGKITVSDTTMPGGKTSLALSDRGSGPRVRVQGTGSIRQSGSGDGGFANTGVAGWPRSGSVTVRNTGSAEVSGGGYANTGADFTRESSRRMEVPEGGFVRNSGHRIQVALTVAPGTVILY